MTTENENIGVKISIPVQNAVKETPKIFGVSIVTHGGAGSGNFGHSGRPGEVGGSGGGGGGGGQKEWDKFFGETEEEGNKRRDQQEKERKKRRFESEKTAVIPLNLPLEEL